MKITVLMENTALEGCGLTPEHGLSLYIQYRGKKLLLDAGSSGKFADNAQALGVDLSGVELAALSHGHYDHADGLRRFFQVNDRAKVYLRPGAEGPVQIYSRSITWPMGSVITSPAERSRATADLLMRTSRVP